MHRALEPDGDDVGLSVPRLAVRFAGESVERPVGRGSRSRRTERRLIFQFVVHRLKWLARIPGAPHIFDAILLAGTALFRPTRLRAMSAIEAAVSGLPGMRVRVHRLGGIGFFHHGKESSHMHGNGLLDCQVGREKRDALISAGCALPHHLFPQSGWVSFWIENEEDVGPAMELIRIASGRPSSS
jgi:hypothetical protein